jgi:RimJ/RimL family protein N-acetyltransferase
MISTQFLVSRLTIRDRAALARHFVALGPEDRRLRFGSSLSDSAVRAFVRQLDFNRDEFHAVLNAEMRILGVVHIARGPGTAELGLSVLESMRGQGIGNAIFAHAVQRLRVIGEREVFVRYLAENQAMMHLARRHGMQIVMDGSDSEGRLMLPRATSETVLNEWWQSQQAAVVDSLRRNVHAVRPRRKSPVKRAGSAAPSGTRLPGR